MADAKVIRRLAAVLSIDVVGYSRLVRADEDGTLAALAVLRDKVIAPRIAESGGRIVKLMGDGILAEFPSALEAVRCGIAVQQAMADRIAAPDAGAPILLRIGINLGDVVIDGDDIQGDGVNVAARLEALAAPGSVCISNQVYEAVRDRIDQTFSDLGEQEVKNISRPVRAWSWAADGAAAGDAGPSRDVKSQKPAVAVLPFDDLSNNRENEALADGLAEDLITALSRTRWFHVAARNSTFAYKGTSLDVRSVARSLGVRYVLEGSVRTAGGTARITVQLIDAESGNHVWADRFDRSLDDVFSLQDEIAGRVASLMTELVWQDAASKVDRMHPENYGAFEHALIGSRLLHRLTPASVRESKRHFEEAARMDPTLSLANYALALICVAEWMWWDDPARELISAAAAHAAAAQEIAPDDAQVYRVQSRIALAGGAFDEARRHAERAVKLNPSDGDVLIAMANYETCAGDPAAGLRLFEEVLAVHSETPHSADLARLWMSINLLVQDAPERALAVLREINGLDYLKNLLFAATHAMLGDERAAAASLDAARAEVPDITTPRIGMLRCFRDPDIGRKLEDALRRAGMPAA